MLTWFFEGCGFLNLNPLRADRYTLIVDASARSNWDAFECDCYFDVDCRKPDLVMRECNAEFFLGRSLGVPAELISDLLLSADAVSRCA